MVFSKSNRLTVSAVSFALILLFTGRIEAGALSDIYKPRVIKLGSPEVLYRADAAQSTHNKVGSFGKPPAY